MNYMSEENQKDVEKQADQIQKEIEEKELKEINQKEKSKTPASIWIVKFLIILNLVILLIFSIFAIIKDSRNILFVILFFLPQILFNIILLYALFKRKRWGWYFGIIAYGASIILSFINIRNNAGNIIFTIIIFIFILISKRYLNK